MKKGSFIAFLFGAGVPCAMFMFVLYAASDRFGRLPSGPLADYLWLIGVVSLIIGSFTVLTHNQHPGADEINAMGAEFAEGRSILWETLAVAKQPFSRPLLISAILLIIGTTILLFGFLLGGLVLLGAQVYWMISRGRYRLALAREQISNAWYEPLERAISALDILMLAACGLLLMENATYGKIDSALALLLPGTAAFLILRYFWNRVPGASRRPGVIGSTALSLWVLLTILTTNYALDYREPIKAVERLASACPFPGAAVATDMAEACEIYYAQGNGIEESKLATIYKKGALGISWHRTLLLPPNERHNPAN